MLLIVPFVLGSAETEFKALVSDHFPTLDVTTGTVWCAYIPGTCSVVTTATGSFSERTKAAAVSLGYDLNNQTSNDCLLYDGEGADLYYGVPKIDPNNTRLWLDTSRIMAAVPGDHLLATDIRHLAHVLQEHDMLCPCALGMECTTAGSHLPPICTVRSISQAANDMWVVALVLIAVAVVVTYVATDD